MEPKRLPNGNLLVMLSGTGPEGEIAEGLQEIDPAHELYPAWDAYFTGLGL